MWTKLKNAVFEEEPTKQQVPQTTAQQPLIQQIQAVQALVGDSSRIEEFKKMFLEKLKAQESTIKFFQFLDMVNDLKAVIPSEDAAFKAAFISLKKSNIQSGEIVISSQRVLSQLDAIKQNSEREMSVECSNIISNKETELSQTNTEISSIEKQLADLGSRLVEVKSKATSLSQEVQSKKNVTASLVGELTQAYSFLSAEFNGLVSRVTSSAK